MHKLFKFFSVLFASCSSSGSQSTEVSSEPDSFVDIPGISIVEQSSKGLFIRLSSPGELSAADVKAIVKYYNGRFDRIDLCVDDAKDRGEEYLSVSESTVFDYRSNTIVKLSDF